VRFHGVRHAGPAGLMIAAMAAGCSAPPPRVWEGRAGSQPTQEIREPAPAAIRLVPDSMPPSPATETVAGMPQPAAETAAGMPAFAAETAAGVSAPQHQRPQDFAPADVIAALRPTSPPPQPPEVAEIRGMLRDYLRAFNRHDPGALAAHWTGAGESIDLASGDTTAGREAVRSVFAALFEQDTSATIDIDVLQVRPIRDDVAVVDGLTRIAFSDAAPAASRFTAVVVKEQGRWLLESVRETSLPADAAAAPSRPLDALGWLVGAWENVGAGVVASADCTWSAGRGFLVRSHAVRTETPPVVQPPAAADDTAIPGLLPPGDPRPRETTEIIGWDPDRRVIRSWVFTSAGRFAEGTWVRDGEVWTVHYEGRGHDEGLESICTIVPHAALEGGPQAAEGLSITCTDDALADLLPPACEFLRTARLD
jgi:uncharacterized protein (TIGR02246 family)